MNLQVDYQRVEVVAGCFASSAFGLGHQRPCHFDRRADHHRVHQVRIGGQELLADHPGILLEEGGDQLLAQKSNRQSTQKRGLS